MAAVASEDIAACFKRLREIIAKPIGARSEAEDNEVVSIGLDILEGFAVNASNAAFGALFASRLLASGLDEMDSEQELDS